MRGRVDSRIPNFTLIVFDNRRNEWMGCGCHEYLQPLEPEAPVKQSFMFLHNGIEKNFEWPRHVWNSKPYSLKCLLKGWNTEFGDFDDSCGYLDVGLHFKPKNFRGLWRYILDLYSPHGSWRCVLSQSLHPFLHPCLNGNILEDKFCSQRRYWNKTHSCPLNKHR